jgi:hypothetical protein
VAPEYEHLIKSVLDQAIIECIIENGIVIVDDEDVSRAKETLLRYGRLVPGDDR